MRIAIRIVCCSSLILAALACGSDRAEPCSAADAAAGRCQAAGGAAPAPAPQVVLPDWALRLCDDWRRPDGSCELMEIQADFEECLNDYGLPEQQRMLAQGAGNRAVQRARERAIHLCLELRHWQMTPEFNERWQQRPQPRAPQP